MTSARNKAAKTYSGSREHNFARRDFEIILDTQYITTHTHILTTLPLRPLNLTKSNHDAHSILEHADTIALLTTTKA